MKKYLTEWAEIYSWVSRSDNLEHLRVIPLRDRLAIAISRISPHIIKHILDFHDSAYFPLTPHSEIINLPTTECVYVLLFARFLGYSTKTTHVGSDNTANIIIFRSGRTNNDQVPHFELSHQAKQELAGFLANNRATIDRITSSTKVESQHQFQRWNALKKAEADTVQESSENPDKLEAEKTRVNAVYARGFVPSDDYQVNIFDPNARRWPPMPTVQYSAVRPTSLPAFEARDLFLTKLKTDQVIMIVGPTGSGKSTQFPQFVYDYMRARGLEQDCRIVMTQPRRLAAISLAHRMAEEQGVPIRPECVRVDGDPSQYNHIDMPVGYSVRGENYGNEVTKIRLCTTGSLLRRMLSRTIVMTPQDILEQSRLTPDMESYWSSQSSVLTQRVCQVLETVTHIFIDEIHESSIETDLLLAALRDAIRHMPHLRVVLMSATAHAQSIAEYMNCKTLIDVKARTYPIDVYYNNDIVRMIEQKPVLPPSMLHARIRTFLAAYHATGGTFNVDTPYIRRRIIEELNYEDHIQEKAQAIGPQGDAKEVDASVLALIKFIKRNSVSEEQLERLGSRFSSSVATTSADSDTTSKAEAPSVLQQDAVNSFPSSADISSFLTKTNMGSIKPDSWAYADDILSKVGNSDISVKLAAPGHTQDPLPHGAILIFVPSWARLQDLTFAIKSDPELSNPSKFAVFQLHSSLSNEVQMRVFNDVPVGVTKIVIGTNIAETSLTITDVTHVIDLGLAKVRTYDTVKDLTTFTLEIAAKSNAVQRKGRTGRTRPGICYRMYSETVFEQMSPQPRPPMLTANVDNTVISLKQFCVAPPQLAHLRSDGFNEVVYFMRRLLNNVSDFSLAQSFSRLVSNGVLDDSGRLSHLGLISSNLPIDTGSARLVVLSALYGCLDAGLTLASYVSNTGLSCIDRDSPNAAEQTARLVHFSQPHGLRQILQSPQLHPGDLGAHAYPALLRAQAHRAVRLGGPHRHHQGR
jgi:HrpA-like RNA helicase